MTYEYFKEIIDLQIAHNRKLDAFYELKVDMLEAFDDHAVALEKLWKAVLTVDGYDWLMWYLYEKNGITGEPRKDMRAWDNEVEICQDLKGLWKYLTDQKYFNV